MVVSADLGPSPSVHRGVLWNIIYLVWVDNGTWMGVWGEWGRNRGFCVCIMFWIGKHQYWMQTKPFEYNYEIGRKPIKWNLDFFNQLSRIEMSASGIIFVSLEGTFDTVVTGVSKQRTCRYKKKENSSSSNMIQHDISSFCNYFFSDYNHPKNIFNSHRFQ